jgi:hypothetical protein
MLDHVVLLSEEHLTYLLRQYQRYFSESRSTQGSGNACRRPLADVDPSKPIAVKSVLGGLHVDYRRAA